MVERNWKKSNYKNYKSCMIDLSTASIGICGTVSIIDYGRLSMYTLLIKSGDLEF